MFDYYRTHSARFFETYTVANELLEETSRILSVGAGSAFVEAVLASSGEHEVTVVDFSEAIEVNRHYYDDIGVIPIALDLSGADAGAALRDVLDGDFDLVLSSEIVEHIPEPPAQHFAKLTPLLRNGGHIIVTTPNLGSLENFTKMVRMQPLLPPPEQAFGPVSFENEGIHRREYMPSEIADAFRRCDLTIIDVRFSWYRHNARRVPGVRRLLCNILPRLHPCFIAIARKHDA